MRRILAATRRVVLGSGALALALSVSGCAYFFGPAVDVTDSIRKEDRMRKAEVATIPYNVEFRVKNGSSRLFMVQREDLQPMFSTDWSRERAESATLTAFGADVCTGGSLALTDVEYEPLGVWIIRGVCNT